MPTDTFVLGQSGGPTSVVNASLAGAIRAALADSRVKRVLGARHGAAGMLTGDYADLGLLSPALIARLARSPGPALASSRLRPSEEELERMVGDLAERGVGWVAVIGGNDSADIMHRLHTKSREMGAAINVVGIPKTVDNDLPGMDHSPGYGSAARALAMLVRGSGFDTAAMQQTDPIKMIEVPGRDSGWLTAGATLARSRACGAPHVVFFPERPRPIAQMADEVLQALKVHGTATVVLSENQRSEKGEPLAGGSALSTDPYGHSYYESPGLALSREIRERAGVSPRYERPGSLIRSLGGGQSRRDAAEAESCGAEAARLALAGQSDVMVAIQRRPGPGYAVDLRTTPLASVASQEQRVPDEYIAPSGIDVTSAFLAYARPLVGAIPPVIKL